jgi:hypothetical protein
LYDHSIKTFLAVIYNIFGIYPYDFEQFTPKTKQIRPKKCHYIGPYKVANAIRLFVVVIYKFLEKAIVFVRDMP